MTARRALQLFALSVALWAVVEGAFAFFGQDRLPLPLALLFDVQCGCTLLLWYRQDALERRQAPSAALGGAIVLLWVVAVPAYLVLSREGAQRWVMLVVSIGAASAFWLAFLLAHVPAGLRDRG